MADEWLESSNYKPEPRKSKLAREMDHGPAKISPSMQKTLDVLALSSTPIPVVGDVMGLAADANMFMNEPESRTAGNFGLSALGLLPFIPSASGALRTVKGAVNSDLSKLIKEAREYEGRLWGGAYGVGSFKMAARTSPKRKMIIAGRKRYNELRKMAGLPEIKKWDKLPETLIQSMKIE